MIRFVADMFTPRETTWPFGMMFLILTVPLTAKDFAPERLPIIAVEVACGLALLVHNALMRRDGEL